MRFFCDERAIGFVVVDQRLPIDLLFFANGGEAGLFARGAFGRVGESRREEEQKDEQEGGKVSHTVFDGCHAAIRTIGRGSGELEGTECDFSPYC